MKPEQPGPAVKPSTPQSASKTNKVKVTDVKPATAAASQPKPATGPQAAGKRGLKDPKTGDIATTYSNYRFTKRWIKEALVAEGLLDKVYKNDELNAEIEATIKGAVVKLEALEKYRV